MIAQSTGLTVPNDIVDLDTEGIFRPFGLGSSIGVKKMTLAEKSSDMHGLLQEFICGYDITTPIVFNPITGNLDFLPTVLYIPEKDSTNWFLGETEKESRSGFKRVSILNLSTELKQVFLKYAHNMSITTYCRIDARIKCNSTDELSHILAHPLTLNNTFFVEMNPMPTVWINNALSYSFQNINTIQSFDEYLLQLKKHVPKKNIHNFLLSISMFALYHSHVQK